MSPTPQNDVPYVPIPDQQDRIVISGMSGLYPQSNNVKELSEILYNKVNPITENLRFKCNHPEVTQLAGTVPELAYFDAQFFKVNAHVVTSMDPKARKILEQAYQAIYDAGINPTQLSGKKVGVYIGSCLSDVEKVNIDDAASKSGSAIAGSSKTMFANRVSYWLNTTGPSLAIDQACCSSTAALEQAYIAISTGICEAAIVGGSNISLLPMLSVHYGRIVKMCDDAKIKSFDERADGFVISEAINVLFLQKAKDAMRVHAELVLVQTAFANTLKSETGQVFGFNRDHNKTAEFLEQFYRTARVPPEAIEYVEAFGSATLEADKAELQAIEKIFCKERIKPLLVGSVISNIGYGEAASGISAITKVLLGYHNGQLAGNLNYEQPRKDIAALRDGRMRVISEHEHFDRTYVAVNGMSVTGLNSHVLLHGCYKPKNLDKFLSSIPHLVTMSGRHEEAVQYALDILKSNPIDPEQLALLHNIHRLRISGHLARGYIVLGTDEEQKPVSLCEKVDYFDDSPTRPLWFVYSGMGSQWAGMGTQLMRIPIFAAAIERCQKVLKPKGLDIVNIITSDDESIFNNILNSFVGIAAIQIGLTDILHELGFKPNNIIGHSVGELGCAYADGCLTTEEMILSAYYRGLVSLETKLIHGSMAAVGLGYKEILKLCPPEIEIACHNGPESSTISGPSNVMREFVAKLTANGIFAKEVPCSNIAYHSHYVADAGPGLLKYLQSTITTPKARSERWLSTSVPKERWDEPIAKLCSAEYLTNNLLSPVLFEETSQLIPNNAVLIEIAPHGLLQAILKRSLPDTCKNIQLTRRKHPDNTILLLQAIGQLYMEGYNSNVQVLYPKVEMPVSTGTPLLSHFVKWAHGEKWPMTKYSSANRKSASECNFILSLHDKEHTYLRGHSIRGNIVYPFAASITLVWEVLAMILNEPKRELSVVFSNVQLYSQPVMHDRRQLKLNVTIQKGTGYFEVFDGSSKVTTGFIKAQSSYATKNFNCGEKNNMLFNCEDIYELLRDRDYFYSDEFQSIARVDESLSDAEIVWRDNWTTFIDGMLQLNVLRQPHNAVSQPTGIRKITIDVKEQHNTIENIITPDGTTLIRAQVSRSQNNTRCGGVTLEGIQFQHLPPHKDTEIVLKFLNFVSYFNSGIDVFSSLEVYFQIVAENLNKTVLNVVGIRNLREVGYLFKEINNVLKNLFRIEVNYKQVTREMALKTQNFEDVDVIFIENLSTDKNICQHLEGILPRDKFIVSEETVRDPGPSELTSLYRVLSIHNNNKQTTLQLVRWGSGKAITGTSTISGKLGGDYYLSVNRSSIRRQNVILQGAQFGNYDSLKWVNVPASLGFGVTVNVHYAAINTTDVKQAYSSSLLKQYVNNTYGMDFSGITESGKRVMGIVRSGTASTQVRAQPELLWPVPAHWTLEDAATVPLAYAQAFYCLGIKVPLPRGETILVHGGAGALGQAVISIALALDCEVFTTVSDLRKKRFLQKLFPELKANHIGCSRDHTFSTMVSTLTEGKKCSVLISCVQGHLKDITFDCISYGGIFLDLSQIQNGDNYNLGMFHLNREGNYVSVDFSYMFESGNIKDLKAIHNMVSEGITRGYVRPLSRVTYAPHEAARAFRLLAASAHRGRVLLRMNENTIQASYGMTCNPDRSSLIICGKSIFGLHFADRLVTRGAKQLYLHVQKQSSYLQHKIRLWQRLGVNVIISSEYLNSQNTVISLLTTSSQLVPLEGVYIIAEETAADHNLINTLEAEIRKLSFDLSYFAVFNFDNSTGNNVCLNRIRDQLPALVITLPEIKKESSNWRGVLDAAECALQKSHGVALAHEVKHKPSLLQQIAKLAELIIPENAATSLTLEELGIQNHKLKLICTFLQVQHNLAFDEEQVLSLTIETIIEIEKSLIDFPCEDIKGLSTFFSYIGSDELVATSDMVLLPTLVNDASMRDDEFEPNPMYLCIVPGMEGNHDRFRVLCERLKLPALVLQPGLDHPHETVKETAQKFSEIMLKKIGIQDKFYLLGYESGVIVALEIAAILEEHGFTGKVFCVGCTPEEFLSELEEQLSPFQDENQVQNGVLRHMYSLISGGDSTILEHELQNLNTWSQKIEACTRSLLSRTLHTTQYVRSIIECTMGRINQMRYYDIAPRPLRSQVILLRAALRREQLPHTALQHVSQQPLLVYQLDSPLAHITTDLRCTTIINENLDPAILQDFASKNICNTYLLNNKGFLYLDVDG